MVTGISGSWVESRAQLCVCVDEESSGNLVGAGYGPGPCREMCTSLSLCSYRNQDFRTPLAVWDLRTSHGRSVLKEI